MASTLNQHILVYLLSCENTIGIRTYQRGIGRKGRFLICRDSLQDWLDAEQCRPFYDMDCGDVLCIRKHGDMLDFRIYWISQSGSTLRGCEQHFTLPVQSLQEIFVSNAPIRHLYIPPHDAARIDQQLRPTMMQGIMADPLKKRALSKAMRDCFHWSDEIVTLYSDGIKDFFFRTSSGYPSCGGLILHETKVHDVSGSYPKLYYSVHT